jgi:hypothetical protein
MRTMEGMGERGGKNRCSSTGLKGEIFLFFSGTLPNLDHTSPYPVSIPQSSFSRKKFLFDILMCRIPSKKKIASRRVQGFTVVAAQTCVLARQFTTRPPYRFNAETQHQNLRLCAWVIHLVTTSPGLPSHNTTTATWAGYLQLILSVSPLAHFPFCHCPNPSSPGPLPCKASFPPCWRAHFPPVTSKRITAFFTIRFVSLGIYGLDSC